MNAFIEKLQAERAVIQLINEKCGLPELCGLNLASIDLWSRQNHAINQECFLILKDLAALIGSVSQRYDKKRDSLDASLLIMIQKQTELLGQKLIKIGT